MVCYSFSASACQRWVPIPPIGESRAGSRGGQKKTLFSIFFFTYVCNSIKIPPCLPSGKREPPVGAGFSGEPQVVSHSVART
jgi:hypothetical protein